MTKLEIYQGTAYFPAVAALEVTLKCNMHCIHCGSSANSKPRENELTLKEWISVVDQLVALGSEYITLSGGEPFIWPHWRELCRHIASTGKTLSIVSNGYHVTDADIDYLRSIGMYNIGLSVDGMKNVHDIIRQTKGSFDRVSGAIKRFKKAGIKVVVATSVNKLNYEWLPHLRQYLSDLGIDLWQVQVVNAFGRAGSGSSPIVVSKEQYVELIEFIRESQGLFKKKLIKMNVMPADSIGYCHGIAADIWGDMEWSGCNAGRYVVGIQSNGNVVGCLSLQNEKFIAGDLHKQTLKDIWEGADAFSYNRNFCAGDLKGSCSGCTSGDACRGGCLAMGSSATGELGNNPYCYKHITEGGLNV